MLANLKKNICLCQNAKKLLQFKVGAPGMVQMNLESETQLRAISNHKTFIKSICEIVQKYARGTSSFL